VEDGRKVFEPSVSVLINGVKDRDRKAPISASGLMLAFNKKQFIENINVCES